jgi:hypothetical protein
MVNIASKIKRFRQKLQSRRQAREEKAFNRELNRSRRREKKEEVVSKLRDTAREKAAPARVEAAATKDQLSKARDEFDPIVVPGGRTAAKAASKAASGGQKAGKLAVEGSKKAADVAGDAAAEIEVPDRREDYQAAERVGRVAEAGPPVERATLSPAGNPRQQERLGRGDGMVSEGSMEALVLGGPREGGFNGSMEQMAMGGGHSDEVVSSDPLVVEEESGLESGLFPDGDGDNGGLL